MAATAIGMPRLGMSMEEGRVVEWRVPIGGEIAKGEILLVIESEKSEVEIESIASGHLRHIYVEVDETVPCGSLLAAVTEAEDEAFDADAFRAQHGPDPEPAAQPAAPSPADGPKTQGATPGCASSAARRAVAPAARAAARKLGIEIESVNGTGPGGRVTRQDVEAYAAARRDLVDVGDGVRLEAPSQGEGDPVLLLPGFGTDISAFSSQIAALTDHHRVIGLNPRGVGLSDAPEAEIYSIAQGASDAASVAALAGGAVHVVGASMGAAMAIELALRAPADVRSLTLITPFTVISARLAALLEGWTALAENATPDLLARMLLPWFFAGGMLGEEAARARLTRGLSASLARVNAAGLGRWAAGLRAWSMSRSADLSRLSVPTLVITAGDDLLAPDGESLAREIPGARHLGIPNAGHAVAIEAAEAVNAALLDHLHA
jgi:pyruvate dehydrogenase E2 component (dihydrolipoamide acetyltransferase)